MCFTAGSETNTTEMTQCSYCDGNLAAFTAGKPSNFGRMSTFSLS